MLTRLVTGILALVLTLLGTVFTVLGLTGADGFLATGLAVGGAGVALAAVFFALMRREAAARQRRLAAPPTTAEIVRARHLAGVQIGSLLTYDLTIRTPAGGEVTRRLNVVPGTPLVNGETVGIRQDPDDPGNFELA